MSDTDSTFIDLSLRGEVLLDEIDDFVDRWHDSDGKIPIHKFLGMKKSEYALWVREPDALAYIVTARRDDRPLRNVVNDNFQELQIAARAEDRSKIAKLKRWLEKQNELGE